jgi:hypothetical protein
MIRVFISYAHADESLRQEFDKHLTSLKHQGIIETWHDRRITAGQEWAAAIDENLRTSDLILLLVSADFISSPYCYETEMQEAIRLHAAGKAIVIPVILRPCEWHGLPFGKLQAATRDGRPITKYPTLDDGFLEVMQAIKGAASQVARESPSKLDVAMANAFPPAPLGVARARARSSNLHVKQVFSDHDRDIFRLEAFEYIARYFDNSLEELKKRNPHLETLFRQRDANSFEAAIYVQGKQKTLCGIWLTSGRESGEINYSSSGLGRGNSYNESLSVADDGQVLGLKAMGMLLIEASDKLMTLEGAAEHLWSAFMKPLQKR